MEASSDQLHFPEEEVLLLGEMHKFFLMDNSLVILGIVATMFMFIIFQQVFFLNLDTIEYNHE